ncbi:MAG: sporulation protein, partial [Thermoanaerobaculia bacterium]|nr:sporulation protein [Thermoanaerobaculia bacterium]
MRPNGRRPAWPLLLAAALCAFAPGVPVSAQPSAREAPKAPAKAAKVASRAGTPAPAPALPTTPPAAQLAALKARSIGPAV